MVGGGRNGINELALQQVRSVDGELGKLKTIIIIIIIRPVERGWQVTSSLSMRVYPIKWYFEFGVKIKNTIINYCGFVSFYSHDVCGGVAGGRKKGVTV